MQKVFVSIFIVILISLVTGGYLIYKKTVNPNLANTPQINEQEIQSSVPTSAPISTISANIKLQKNSPKPSPSLTPRYSSTVKLESIVPNTASSGEEIKLLGSGFGTVVGKVYLYNQILGPSTIFADVTPNRWTDTEIKITVPPAVGGQTINAEVLHKDGTKSNRTVFVIKGGQPRIDSISPNNAQPLQEISISGKEFGANTGSVNIHQTNSKDFSSPFAKCQITSWENGLIKCTLPNTLNNGSEYGFEIVSADNRRSSFIYYKVGN